MSRELLNTPVSGTVNVATSSEVHSVLFLLLVVVVLLGYLYNDSPTFKKFEVFFPHSSANMVFGIIVGAIVAAAVKNPGQYSFDGPFFFHYLLPPIIFSAGFAVRKDFFFHNFASIMSFAFIGTLISSFFIGGCLYSMGQNGSVVKMTFVDAMILGSLISAVDPVAVIIAVKELKVDDQLKVILFGEAVLNDAAAVVINRVFASISSHRRSHDDALGWAVPEIIGITLGSIAVGTVFSLLAAYVHKHTNLDKHPAWEMAAFLLAAYTPYAIAEACRMSGITAVLFAGIMSDYYTFYHLSAPGQNASKVSVRTFAHLAESFVFVYLGMSFFLTQGHDWDMSLCWATLFLCLIGRLVSTFPLAFLLNTRRRHKIPFKHQLILWFSGLRGPVAYALALAVPNELGKLRGKFLSTTLFVVAFTTVVLGAFAYWFVKCLEPGEMESTNKDFDYTHHWFNRLDKAYLKPWFGPLKRTARQDPLASSKNLAIVVAGDQAHLRTSQASTPVYEDRSHAVQDTDHDVLGDVTVDQEQESALPDPSEASESKDLVGTPNPSSMLSVPDN